jgi:membrane protease YdiL (CAAX protease family)
MAFLSLNRGNRWFDRKKGVLNVGRHGMAWGLCLCFFMIIPLEFASMNWVQTDKGTWLIVPGEPDSLGMALGYFCWSMASAVCGVGFAFIGVLTKFSWERKAGDRPLTALDLAYYTAWIQSLSVLTSACFILWPHLQYEQWMAVLFPYLPFVWMAGLAWVFFRGRPGEIGLMRPDHKFWLVVPWVLLGIYVLVFLFMESWITQPVARFFSLELSSWRENSISEGVRVAGKMGWGALFEQWLMIGAVGPLAEEMFFRGMLQPLAERLTGLWGGVLFSAVLFALFHLDIPLLAPLFALGLILALLRVWKGHIWAAVLFHVLNNTVSLLYDYFAHSL